MEDWRTHCGICLDLYDEPRALPCLHSFCTPCLKGLANSNQTRCPECRKEFTLPNGNVEELPMNFYLKKKHKAHECVDEGGLRCSSCQQDVHVLCRSDAHLLCRMCASESHAEHDLVLLDEIERTTLNCTKHAQGFSLYCTNCKCLLCPADDHSREHQLIRINTLAEHPKRQLHLRFAEASSKREQLANYVKGMHLAEEKLRQSEEATKQTIHQTFGRIEEVMHLTKEALLKEAEKQFGERIMHLIEEKREGEVLMVTVDTVNKKTQSLLQVDTPDLEVVARCDVLTRFGTLLQEVDKMCDCLRHSQEKLTEGAVTKGQYEALSNSLQMKCLEMLHWSSLVHADSCHLKHVPSRSLYPKQEFTMTLVCKNGLGSDSVSVTSNQLQVLLLHEDGSRATVTIAKALQDNEFLLICTMQRPGIHRLTVLVNKQNISGSPFTLAATRSCTAATSLHHSMYSPEAPCSYRALATSHSSEVAALVADGKSIDLFDNKGHFVRNIGQRKVGKGIALTFDRYNNILVIDSDKQMVRKFSQSGLYLGRLIAYGGGEQHIISPARIVTTRQGLVYITDTTRDRVLVYSEEGQLLRALGAYGSGPMHFKRPTALCIGPDDHLYVVDSGNTRIQILSQNGEYISQIGKDEPEIVKFINPCDISVSRDGVVIVTDCEANAITMLTSKGEFIRSVTSTNKHSIFQKPIAAVAMETHELLLISQLHPGVHVISSQ